MKRIPDKLHALFSEARKTRRKVSIKEIQDITKNAEFLVRQIAKGYGYYMHMGTTQREGFRFGLPCEKKQKEDKSGFTTKDVRKILETKGVIYFDDFSNIKNSRDIIRSTANNMKSKKVMVIPIPIKNAKVRRIKGYRIKNHKVNSYQDKVKKAS